MNSFIRFKLALTENRPIIIPYKENSWAELSDALEHPIASSLLIIQGVHLRWVTLLNAITDDDFQKTFLHPENNREISLEQNLLLYEWHCNYHYHHILKALAIL